MSVAFGEQVAAAAHVAAVRSRDVTQHRGRHCAVAGIQPLDVDLVPADS